jgi:hypothetical protein
VVGRGSSKHFIKNRYKKLQLLPGGYVSLCRRQEASLNKHFGYELYKKWDITKVHMVFKFVHNEWRHMMGRRCFFAFKNELTNFCILKHLLFYPKVESTLYLKIKNYEQNCYFYFLLPFSFIFRGGQMVSRWFLKFSPPSQMQHFWGGTFFYLTIFNFLQICFRKCKL